MLIGQIEQLLLLFTILLFVGLPWTLFFVKNSTLSKCLSLSPGYAVLIISVIFSLMTIIELPFNNTTIYAFLFFHALMYVYLFRIRQKKFPRLNLSRGSLLLIPFVLVIFISRIVPIINYYAPPLHDPSSHSLWTKSIIDDQTINYFYSPGLHIVSAVIELIRPLNIPFTVSAVTNFFNGFYLVGLYILLKDKKYKNLTVLTICVIALASNLPTNFFYTAGKNSLIVAWSLLPVYMSFLGNRGHTLVKNSVWLYGISIIHYPTAFYAGIYYVCFQFAKYVSDKKDAKLILINTISSTLIALLLLALFVVPRLNVVMQQNQSTSNNSIASVNPVSSRVLHNLSQIKQYAISIISQTGYEKIIILLIIPLIIFSLHKLQPEGMWSSSSLGAIIFLNVVGLKFIEIIPKTGELLSTLFFILPLAHVLNQIAIPKKINLILTISLILIVIYSSMTTFRMFAIKQSSLNVVTENDMRAFEWIKSNLHDEVVINNAIVTDKRRAVVFPVDAGLWLPIYTNSNVSMSFAEFMLEKTHENYRHYEKIKNNPDDGLAIQYFIDNDMKILYIGDRPVFGPVIDSKKLNVSPNYELLYESGNASVYRLIPN